MKGGKAVAEYDGFSKIYIPQGYKEGAMYLNEEQEQVYYGSSSLMKEYKKLAKGEFKKLIKGKSFGPHDNTKSMKATKAEKVTH